MRSFKFNFVCVFCIFIAQISFAQSWVVSTIPTQNELNVPQDTNITITFSEDINPETLTNQTIVIHSSQTGLHPSSNITYDCGSNTLTFDPDENFMVGEVVTISLTTGIHNADGDAMPEPYNWGFTVIVTEGTGHFFNNHNIEVGDINYYYEKIISSDFNNDGYLDLALTSAPLSLLLNDGSGSFNHSSFPLEDGESMCCADFSNDNDIDLAVVSYDTISILENDGMGNFTQSFTINGGNFAGICPFDFDSDGDIDIVVGNWWGEVTLFSNIGDNVFIETGIIEVDYDPQIIESGDLNNDGYIDLIVVCPESEIILPLININDGNDMFVLGEILENDYSDDITIGDWDGDNDLDLVAIGYGEGGGNRMLKVWRNNGNGNFNLFSSIELSSPYVDVFSLTNGDVDNDDDLDIICTNEYLNTLTFYENDGNGNFIEGIIIDIEGDPADIVSGDFNNDGSLDIATANSNFNNVSIFKNCSSLLPEIILNPVELSLVIDEEDSGSEIVVISNIGHTDTLFVYSIFAEEVWLDTDITEAIIPPLQSIDLEVTFDGSMIDIGDYFGQIFIQSNDPNNPAITIDATMEVVESHIQDSDFTELPQSFVLYPNHPNPFNPTTTIRFDLPEKSNIGLSIYDITGKLVTTLVNEEKEAGYHSVIWNGKDENGESVESGVYIYRLESEGIKEIRLMTLLR